AAVPTEDGVEGGELLLDGGGQHLAGAQVTLPSEVVVLGGDGESVRVGGGFQGRQRRRHDLGPDSVAGDDRQPVLTHRCSSPVSISIRPGALAAPPST